MRLTGVGRQTHTHTCELSERNEWETTTKKCLLSKLLASMALRLSSEGGVCSDHVTPLSLRNTQTSRLTSFSDAKCGTSSSTSLFTQTYRLIIIIIIIIIIIRKRHVFSHENNLIIKIISVASAILLLVFLFVFQKQNFSFYSVFSSQNNFTFSFSFS